MIHDSPVVLLLLVTVWLVCLFWPINREKGMDYWLGRLMLIGLRCAVAITVSMVILMVWGMTFE
jgi:hypothetical protein